jgi:hypothetical protein
MIVLLVFTLLVLVPATVAYFSATSFVFTPLFGVGAPVVFLRQKMSANPGPDARDVWPSERGEFYYYNEVNYLRVIELLDDGRVIAVTTKNKRFCFWGGDSQFRKARLTECLLHPRRFPRA